MVVLKGAQGGHTQIESVAETQSLGSSRHLGWKLAPLVVKAKRSKQGGPHTAVRRGHGWHVPRPARMVGAHTWERRNLHKHTRHTWLVRTHGWSAPTLAVRTCIGTDIGKGVDIQCVREKGEPISYCVWAIGELCFSSRLTHVLHAYLHPYLHISSDSMRAM